MHVIRNWARWLAIALILGAGAGAAHADKSTIDAVLLLDVSREMERTGSLEPGRKLLLDLVPRVVRPGAQVAFIAFGEGAHEPHVFRVPLDAEGAARTRLQLREVIEAARPVDRHRFIYAAVERALEQLDAFRRRHPTHDRRIVLVSMGARKVPSVESSKPIAQRIKRFDGPGMAVGRDWSLWYGYFRGGDPGLLRYLAERGAGAAVTLSGGRKTRWTSVRVDSSYVELGGGKLNGQWKRKVKVALAGPRGASVSVRAGAGDAAGAATLTVLPSELKLREGLEEATLRLSGYARPNGTYRDAWLRIDAAGGSPVWVTGARVAVLAGGDGSAVSFADPVLTIGRVDRGTKVTREFGLVANDDARRRGAELAFEVTDVPPDVGLKIIPEVVRLDKQEKVRVELSARRRAKPGSYESRIILRPRGSMRAGRREVTVRYRVGRGGVQILEQRVVAPKLVPGSDVVARITLRPDIGAVEAGARIEVVVGDLPNGIEVECIRKFALHEETVLEVRLRADRALRPGPRTTELRFAASGEIRVVPSVVSIDVEVVAPPPLVVAASHDMGEVYQTQADRIETAMPIDVPHVHHGTLLEFEPTTQKTSIEPLRVRLREGKQDISLSIDTSSHAFGPSSATFRVYSIRGGDRRFEGKVTFHWRVRESYLELVSWSKPLALRAGETLVAGSVEIESSPDLKGTLLKLQARFEGLPFGSHIAAVVDSIELTGARQKIRVPFDVVEAEPGTYPGTLELVLETPHVTKASLRPLAFEVTVASAPLASLLLDPEKRKKLLLLGGALILIFFMFAVLFRLLRNRKRPTVEFVRPAAPPRRELDDYQSVEVRDGLDDSF